MLASIFFFQMGGKLYFCPSDSKQTTAYENSFRCMLYPREKTFSLPDNFLDKNRQASVNARALSPGSKASIRDYAALLCSALEFRELSSRQLRYRLHPSTPFSRPALKPNL